MAAARPTLLVPRERPGRAVDVATRAAFIARQGRRGRRLRRSLRLLGSALGTALVLTAIGVTGVAGAHALRTSPLLGVAEVTIAGARRIPEATLRAAAGIPPGTNLLALDLTQVVDRVEALPGVLRARVVRHLPNRVVVAVEEREPYALVNLGRPDGAGSLVWIDAEGYLVGPERHGATPALPILSGVEPPPAAAEQPVGDRLRGGLALLRAVQRAGARAAGRVSEIDVQQPGGPVLYLVDGVAVWLGSEGWEERLARLDAVLAGLTEEGERVESVDLRFRDLVVLRPRPAAAGTGETRTRGR